MKAYVASVGAVPIQPVVNAPASAGGADLSERDQTAEEAERLARYRLIIEEGPGPGFVYKTLDRVTGEVVSQYPRDEVLKLQQDPGYASGKVIDTTA